MLNVAVVGQEGKVGRHTGFVKQRYRGDTKLKAKQVFLGNLAALPLS
jgi:hypothetical protein